MTITTTIKKMTKKVLPMKKDLGTLHDLFLVQMKDLYDTELQIEKALPKVISNTTNRELSHLLKQHLKETQNQIKRLEDAYESIGEKPKRQTSKGMKGLIDDGNEVMSMDAKTVILDAAITANAEHIEHHEIAGYKATIVWAKLMKHTKAASLLEKNLKEEEMMNKRLQAIAKNVVNKKAAQFMH